MPQTVLFALLPAIYENSSCLEFLVSLGIVSLIFTNLVGMEWYLIVVLV